jgi:hypothetical protein
VGYFSNAEQVRTMEKQTKIPVANYFCKNEYGITQCYSGCVKGECFIDGYMGIRAKYKMSELEKQFIEGFWRKNWKDLTDEPRMTKAQVMAENEDSIWIDYLKEAFRIGLAKGRELSNATKPRFTPQPKGRGFSR